MEFSCKQVTIGEILQSEKFYSIPKYQRDYVWNDKKIRDLWNDITFNVDESGQIKYFLGSFIVKTGENSDELIDGQQRLTSIIILLSIICKKVNNLGDGFNADYIKKYCVLANKETKTLTSRIDRNSSLLLNAIVEYCTNTTTHQSLKDYLDTLAITSHKSDKTLLTCYDIYYIYIETLVQNKSMEESIIILMSICEAVTKTSAILINVENAKTASLVFETINARGYVLETGDLVKNYLFMYEIPIGGKSTFEKTWGEIVKCIEDSADSSLTRFITHYCTSFFGKTKKADIYDVFKSNTPRNTVTSRIKSILSSAEIYSHIVCGNDNVAEHRELNYYLTSLNNMGISILRPLLLSVLIAFNSGKIDYKTLCNRMKKIVNFFSIFVCVCGNKTNALEKNIYDYAHKLNENFSVQNLDKFINCILERKPSEDIFEHSFIMQAYTNHKEKYEGITLNKKKVQYILGVYELFLEENESFTIPKFSLEHIKDDSKGGNACFIGNFVILPQRQNNKLAGKSINEKIAVYADSCFALTRKFAKNSDATLWDDDTISRRAKFLAKEFYSNIWDC